jgi:hypothetical protein
MDPFEKDELSDSELDSMLPQWKAPDRPERLRAALFPERRAWWKKVWSLSIPVPVPVAVILVALAVVLAMRWPRERVEFKPVQVAADRSPNSGSAWRPVAELRPRIVRSNQ